jgi:peptidoglycan/LPS O-acetylase OafA/YrhL
MTHSLPRLTPRPRATTTSGFDLRAVDGLRGLAALYIVVHHARIDLWQGTHAALAAGGFAALFAYATVPLKYGAEVVLLFFLLSGFVIHLRQARSLSRGETPSFRALSFFRRRATRLLPPLLFALVFTAALDAAGSWASASEYAAYPAGHVFAGGRTAFAFAMNALFLQGFAAPPFGSNSPLRSLSYEAIFYALYPLFLLARVRFGARAAFGATFAAAAAGSALHVASPAIAWTILPYFAVWSLGALVAEAFAQGVSLRRPVLMLVGGAALVAPVLAAPGRLDPTIGSTIFASGLALVMAVFVLHPMGFGAASMFARLRGLGARSYTLYVLHVPILVFLAALWVRTRGSLPGSGWLMAPGIALALAAAYAVAPIVELPFSQRAKQGAIPAARPAPRVVRGRIARPVSVAAAPGEEVADVRQSA